MKLLIVALFVGCAIALAWRSFHHSGAGKPPDSGSGFFGAFKKAAAPDASRIGAGRDTKQHGSFDIYAEHLRAECGPYFIRTDGGQYEVGRMSNKGLVLAIRQRVVRVSGPDGRPGFIVCDDMSSAVAAGAPPDAGQLAGNPVASGTVAGNPKALFRTGAASDGGLSPPPPVVAPVLAPVAKAFDGPKPKDAADWWPSAVPGW